MCTRLLLLLFFFQHVISSEETRQRLICNAEGETQSVMEGDGLQVCVSRAPPSIFFQGEIKVSLFGREGAGVDGDFVIGNDSLTIESGENCTTIQTVVDNDHERNEIFTIVLSPNNITCMVVVIDDDGPNIECPEQCMTMKNRPKELQWSCCPPLSNSRDQCSGEVSVDCTRWNASLFSSLLSNSEVNSSAVARNLFPKINHEFMGGAPNNTSCTKTIKSLLEVHFGDYNGTRADPMADDPRCHTNCTATLSDGCNLTIFLLENIDIRGIGLSSIEVPSQCGVFDITCCTDSLPPDCHQDPVSTKSNRSAIIGGAVGASVGLAIIIIVVVLISITACFCQRTKRKQWETSPATRVQSIVYKPRRLISSQSAMSSISQNSNTVNAITSRENGRVEPEQPEQPEQPDYEEVNHYYAEWKETFNNIIIDDKHLQYEDVIGEGEFSRVYHANYDTTNQQVAVKILKNITDEKEIEKFMAESTTMRDFDHPNILSLVGVCLNTVDHLPAIILPFMQNGDLRNFLNNKRANLSSSTSGGAMEKYPEELSQLVLLGMCMDIARGMHYLSQCKFVHRDLAARNCMVDEKLQVKVADFGLSRDIHVSDYYRLTHRQKLPVKWMAPESLFKKIYNTKTDVWSYGIVCWEIFKLGKKPYAGIDNPDLPDYISHGYRLKKPSRCPAALFELIQDMWMEDPMRRPDFATIVKFLAKITDYEGDIDRDLEEDASKYRLYQVLEPPSHQSTTENGRKESTYSVLEKPVYNNFSSKEGSTGTPEEYEVPLSLSNDSGHSMPLAYEIPQPMSELKNISSNGRDKPRNFSSHKQTYSLPGLPAHSGVSNHLKPVTILQQNDEISTSAQRAGSRTRNAAKSRQVSDPSLQGSESEIPITDSLPAPEKSYSSLEWKKKGVASSSATLPNHSKRHIYHTLEPQEN